MTTIDPSQVRAFREADGTVEYQVMRLVGWDDFDLIISFVSRQFSASVSEKVDGLSSRTLRLRVGDIDVVFKHHDELGNYFFSEPFSVSGNALAERIAEAISAQFTS